MVVNPRAGDPWDRGVSTYLQMALPAAKIVELSEGEDLGALLQGEVEGCDVLGIAGGDGSVSAAAAVALQRDKPILVLPSGTLNRFARDLGIESIDDGVRAVKGARSSEVDLGSIDGDVFVNTASLGVYVSLVEARNRLERIIGRWPSGLVALIRILRTTDPVHVEVDGESIEAWLVFFGNCRFLPEGLAPSTRPRLEDGQLDVPMVQASYPFPRLRLMGTVLTGTLPASWMYRAKLTDRPVRVRTLQGPTPVARDGEILDGAASFTVTKAANRLVVLLPED